MRCILAYKIVRHYFNAGIKKRVIATSLTLEEAQNHCKDPNSSWKTFTRKVGKDRTRKLGVWFDSYTEF